MKDEEMPNVEKQFRCRTTQRWLDDRKVREKREIFRVYRDDPDRPEVMTRRERVVTFYTRLRGSHRLDNELWYATNDPAERELLRAELREFFAAQPVAPISPS
jgi:hypothetical protein